MTTDNRQKILIVDDERLNLAVLNDLLKDDYRIFLAKSGAQALERIKSNPPDLILLDVMMPDMDGYQVCRRIKSDERTKEIPIMFVTAMDSLQYEEQGLNLGALDYITKPFHPPIIKARVRNILTFVRQRRLLEKMARLDGLTEIPNRRSFMTSLDLEWRRCARSRFPLSLAMLDIDFFKQFNDNYGHTNGDEALKAVATTLFANIRRPGDVVARYGGEEFVMLLPNTESQGAFSLAEDIRNRIQALGIRHDFSDASSYLTSSIGGATIVPSTDTTPNDLINKADTMLYRAKHQGKNRVFWE